MLELLIICPLAFAAGFVDAIAGGGGLISLPAFILAGVPVHNALATNKLMSTMGTAISTLRYALSGYMVPTFVVVGVACGLSGSSVGANLALLADASVLKAVMLAALPFIAYFVMKSKSLDAPADESVSRVRAAVITGAVAFAVGMYDGFYGPGTGTFLLLLLTSLAHQDIRTAAGTTKAINLSTNVAALVVFAVNGAVIVWLGLVAGIFNIAGNYLGSRKFTREGAHAVRPLMIAVLVLFAARLVFDLVTGA